MALVALQCAIILFAEDSKDEVDRICVKFECTQKLY